MVLVEGMHCLRNLNQIPVSEAPVFGVTCFSSLASCLRSGMIWEKLWEEAPRKLEGDQKGLRMEPAWAEFANMGAKGTFPNWLWTCSDFWFVVVFKTLDEWQQLWDSKTKRRKEYLSLLKVQSVGLCGYVLFTKSGARAERAENKERKGSGKWTRAQEDELWRHLEKEMLDPEDCHLEGKELVNAWKLITLPGAKVIKSRKEELRGTFFCFCKMEIALLLF